MFGAITAQSQAFRRDMTADKAVAILLSGVIAGVVSLISCVSFAALMFNGALSGYISTGISILVSTAVVAGALVSLFSGCRPLVALPDERLRPLPVEEVELNEDGFVQMSLNVTIAD